MFLLILSFNFACMLWGTQIFHSWNKAWRFIAGFLLFVSFLLLLFLLLLEVVFDIDRRLFSAIHHTPWFSSREPTCLTGNQLKRHYPFFFLCLTRQKTCFPSVVINNHTRLPCDALVQNYGPILRSAMGGIMVVVLVVFFSLARILGECSTIHSPSALAFCLFFFFSGD